MAMPRYKYAIGNAPVRFPSASTRGDKVDVVIDAEAQGKPRLAPTDVGKDEDRLRMNRWSLLSIVGMNAIEAETTNKPLRKARSQQDLRLPVESTHNRRTSMQLDGGAAQRRGRPNSMHANAAHHGHLRSPARFDPAAQPKRQITSVYRGLPYDAHARARPVSWILPGSAAEGTSPISPGGSRSSSRASNVRPEPSEQTQLLSSTRTREMTQSHDKQSLRPSSLFWTDIGTRQKMSNSRPLSGTSYGSMATNQARRTADDPYGYRALAGPTLLPAYHQERRQVESEQSTGFTTIMATSMKMLPTSKSAIICIALAIITSLSLILHYTGIL